MDIVTNIFVNSRWLFLIALLSLHPGSLNHFVSRILISTKCSNLPNVEHYLMSISCRNLSPVLGWCFGTHMRLSYHITTTKSLYCRLTSHLELYMASKLIKIYTHVLMTWSSLIHMYGQVRLFTFRIAHYPFDLICHAICWQTVITCIVLFAMYFRFWPFFRWLWNIK